ncbi:MAG TPA: alkaline phosphatase family protein [Acidobacteriaceae bacterium]|nr:alkaline phosphatase family protein [Acidobacteriaceae bacterium]
MPTPFKRIVVLMMENRSFDHMLGYLKSSSYPIDGLNGDETNPAADEGTPIRVSPNARNMNDLNPDPNHEFPDINWQIFSNPDGTDYGQEKMQGFVHNYASDSGNAARGAVIMRCFHPGTLPILSTLAQQFGVSDQWFSSVPGSTIPNRLFAHAASSGSSLTQDAIKAPFLAHTIFQDIDEDPIDLNTTYRIYASQSSILLANGHLMRNQDKFFDIETFAQDCRNNDIPQYTFIEPIYDGVNANSQHPDFAIDKGEAFIGEIYNAIRDSPLWTDTLLLIVYDEHGGLYDHVFPPMLKNETGLPGIPATTDFGFTFDRLGVRVPAVFVSPWIKPGTILPQQFDHCSIVKTIRQLCCKTQTPFNWRESIANSFLNIVDTDGGPMRTDKPDLPPVVSSDGTISLQGRNQVLPASARGSRQPVPAVLPNLAALAKTTRTPNIPPVVPPTLRKPTDLVTLMAQSMEYSLGQQGVRLSKTTQQIYSAQDADAYLAEARTAVKNLGGA